MKKTLFFAVFLLLIAQTSCKKKEETRIPLPACFTISPDTIYTGTEVTFDASCNNLSGVAYEWYIADTGLPYHYIKIDTPTVTHTYSEAGSYPIILSIQDTAYLRSPTNIPLVAFIQTTITVK